MTTTSLCLWCTDLASTCSYGTIRVYLSALSKFAIENGYEGINCKDNLLVTVLTEIEANQTAVKKPLRQPITCALLAELKTHIDTSTHDGRMIWAIMTLATSGLFEQESWSYQENSILTLKSCYKLIRLHLRQRSQEW